MRPPIISIVLSVLCAAILGATPVSELNSADFEIKFVIDSNTPVKWIAYAKPKEGRGHQAPIANPGPIKPTYVARVCIRDDSGQSYSNINTLDAIQESPVAKKFSKPQQAFLKTGFAILVEGDRKDPFHYSATYLYAVSKEDAELMARAYLDGLTRSARQVVAKWKDELSKNQEKLRVAQKELSEKQAELKKCEEKYKQVKDKTHKLSSNAEAPNLAKENILEMDKALGRLQVEMIGIRAKLDVIQKYRDKTAHGDALYAKLNEMYVEQMIEMSGLEARWAATEDLRAKQQAFFDLYNEKEHLRSQVYMQTRTIKDTQGTIKSLMEFLAHPKANTMFGNMLPPEVYQNTITIHPVAP
jgi:hypothetical protein